MAWNPLGWQAVASSEIEPFPRAVLAHHYPGTPNWGDKSKSIEWPGYPAYSLPQRAISISHPS